MTWDNDYAYIQVFIDFLKQIIEIIKSLFGGLGGSSDDGAADDEAAAE
ncbi:MAG: hypothetical protein IKL47_07195 [Clostridia bacterium]|nr:hypothetical protein [Clostridia bacterium]